MEKQYCIFIAEIIDDDILENINTIRKQTKEMFNIDLKPSLKMNNNNKTIQENKLNSYGIPQNIVTGNNITNKNSNDNMLELLTKELNDDVKTHTKNQLFIVNMEEYDKLIDKFYNLNNNLEMELPQLEGFNILSIKNACTITTTENYMKKNCVNIAQMLKKKIELNK